MQADELDHQLSNSLVHASTLQRELDTYQKAAATTQQQVSSFADASCACLCLVSCLPSFISGMMFMYVQDSNQMFELLRTVLACHLLAQDVQLLSCIPCLAHYASIC
jgi:hypothetical protein